MNENQPKLITDERQKQIGLWAVGIFAALILGFINIICKPLQISPARKYNLYVNVIRIK